MARVALIVGSLDGCEAAVAQSLRELGYAIRLMTSRAPAPHGEQHEADSLQDMCELKPAESSTSALASISGEPREPLVLVYGLGSTPPTNEFSLDELGLLFSSVKAVWPRMARAQFGRIVSVVPIASLSGEGGLSVATAGSAIRGFTKALAAEGGKIGITVNTVVTSCVGNQQATIAPVGRCARSVDLARGVKFLCEEAAGFINGATLSINGGLHMY